MILGGAQENTLYTVLGLNQKPGYEVTLVTGPAIGPEGELLEEARKSGIRVMLVPEMRREIHPWRDFQTLLSLTRLLKELSPEIVHTHSSKAGILGRLAARRAHVPFILHTIHGQAFHPNQNWILNTLFKNLEWYVSRFTDRIITVADAMRDQAVAAGIAPASKFITIYSGMDVGAFLNGHGRRTEMRRKLGFGEEQTVVGKVARLAPLKGYEYIIELAHELMPRHPELRFLFVGDGQLRTELEAQAQRLGVRDRIVFAGLVPAQEVPAYLSAMDILVHASLREGLARVLPQALISGKPVVSFDVDGAREVVRNEETGFLVRAKDLRGLVESVEKLVAQPALGKRMGERGRELFTRQFDQEVMVDRIDELYHCLEAGQPASQPPQESRWASPGGERQHLAEGRNLS